MQEWVKSFVADLHVQGLKTLGFTKKHHTFSRVQDEYVERIQLQGSSWNSGENPEWTFYLNAGVFFLDLPAPTANRGFSGTHAYGRLKQFCQECEDAFVLRQDETEAMRREVLDNVVLVSDSIVDLLPDLREFAKSGKYMWIAGRNRPSKSPA